MRRTVEYAVPRGSLWAPRRVDESPAARVRLAHVDQGELSDCFLAAAMGAIALKRPEVISSMLAMRGDRVEVRLPDRTVSMGRELPMRNGRPVFAGSGGDGALWPAYLEAAIAGRRRGGYAGLDRGGEIARAFQWITGVRPLHSRRPQRGSVIREIGSDLRAGHPVVLGSRRSIGGSALRDAMDAVALVGNHSYVATSVSGRVGAEVLRLWNVWGVSHPRLLTEPQVERMFDEVVTDERWYRLGQ